MKPTAIRLEEPLLLLLGFFFLVVFTARAPYSWGEASRLATVEALVERGTPVLDGGSYPGQGDKLVTAGGMVSHQPPGLQLALTPAYWILDKLGFPLRRAPQVVCLALTLLSCGLAWLLCGYALHRRHRAMGVSARASLLLVGALLFGSLMLPYGLVLNAHLPAGVLVLLGLLLLSGQPERFDHFLGGLFFGAAFACDHAAMFFVGPALLFRALRGRAGMAGILAGVLPGIVVSSAWYHHLGGSWLPLVFQQGRFDYAYSPWLTPVMSLTGGMSLKGAGTTAWELLLGDSGLLFNHPVLLFPLAGLVALWRRHRDWAAAAVLAGLLLMTAYYALSSRNLGGDCFGVRWFAMAVPPMGLGLLPAAAWLQRRAAAAAFVLLLLPSLAFAVVGAQQPWMRFYLTRPFPTRPELDVAGRVRFQCERRAQGPPPFSMDYFVGFYRQELLPRFAAQVRARATAGAGLPAYEAAVEHTRRMLVNTGRDPALWKLHAEFLEGAGRFTEAAEARQEAERLRSG